MLICISINFNRRELATHPGINYALAISLTKTSVTNMYILGQFPKGTDWEGGHKRHMHFLLRFVLRSWCASRRGLYMMKLIPLKDPILSITHLFIWKNLYQLVVALPFELVCRGDSSANKVWAGLEWATHRVHCTGQGTQRSSRHMGGTHLRDPTAAPFL